MQVIVNIGFYKNAGLCIQAHDRARASNGWATAPDQPAHKATMFSFECWSVGLIDLSVPS